MTRTVQSRLAFLAVSAFCLAHAATLPYQGLATDAKNNPKADSSYAVEFALYSASSGGTALWSESQTVTTSKGLFSTTLGSVTAIPDALFQGSALYLGVNFGGGSEGGRVLLGTTPWASAAGKSTTSAYADSAGKVAGLSDSVGALRLSLGDSVSFVRANVHDTADTLRARIKDSSVVLRSKIRVDSVVLAQSVTDSTKALQDTVTSLNMTIAGLNTELSSQSATITSLSNSVDALQALLLASNNGVAWNSSVNYGYFKDSRDGQVYRTVTIGSQTWMAQNLNYAGSGTTIGVCPGAEGSTTAGTVDSCTKYGRLYTWAQVMNGSTSSATSPSGVQGICPTGWHVPSDAEWQSLEVTLGMSVATAATSGWRGTTEGTKLKSTSGWTTITGTDLYGFRVLPAGFVVGGSFYYLGYIANFWSASESAATYAWYRHFRSDDANVKRSDYYKSNGISLRCLKN